jgi:hypothetical protein
MENGTQYGYSAKLKMKIHVLWDATLLRGVKQEQLSPWRT